MLFHLYLAVIVNTVAGQVPQEDASFNTDGQEIGMISGVDVDSRGDLYVFHRADRPWTDDLFEPNSNSLSALGQVPIHKDPIFKLDPKTGRKISSFGGDIFNIPHGLKIDANDTIWVTDVGRHQVLRFRKGATTPDLILGEKFVPGNDDLHFCKPTDVSFSRNGDFFVADGYCNNRVLKFSSDGRFITQWGVRADNDNLTMFTLDTPHSLTYIDHLDLICVADREHSRALCYNAGNSAELSTGTFNRTLIGFNETGKVFSIYYNQAGNDVISAGEISRDAYSEGGQLVYPPRAFTYDLEGNRKEAWSQITPAVSSSGPSLIHALCVSKDGQDIFLSDIVQQKVFKYTRRSAAVGK
ncbi:probable peptidyl-alpha-hydroxyglycine alpha-amidating lyase pgal-1 [Physella acuta]|uniref:probable peptidyl-alpha-hydroxyglycine alpha-amidating lyase pgal-1 n=1 Tax=Physella acuta TaxID=109671 RepID=UPI0027DBFD0D|nr:probable peptidyl-alpha-hydroxyglycine alpha-amidating lyase pgal-1 [Physella acuta]